MTKFISEISSNHNKSLKRSLKLIRLSKEIGFDIVKFQLFKIDQLFSQDVLKHSKKHRMRKNWELSETYIHRLSAECKKLNIKFCVTPFYLSAVDIIKPFVDYIKIASYEILWNDLLKKCALTKKPIIISTGMANIIEVENAVKILKKFGCKKIIILHCVSNYPASLDTLNLSSIEYLRKKFKVKVGWSDHSNDELVISRAVEKWKSDYVEMHLDLDGKGYEFNTGHCWLPDRAKKVIKFCKEVKIVDGKFKKKPSIQEFEERKFRADPIDGLRPIKKYRKF